MTLKDRGFTLIELVTVMAMMGMVLFFTLPRFDAFHPFGVSMTSTGKLMLLVEQLKSRAIETGQDCLLHLDPATGKVWVTAPGLIGEESETAGEKEYGLENEPMIVFSEDCILEDVKMPVSARNQETVAGDTVIRFSGDGYCDQAFVHIRDNDVDFTVVVEPFLPRPQLLDGRVFCGE